MRLTVGDRAPEFSLPDQADKLHRLKNYRGQWVLLYFYPKDDTPGCTTEACTIRDRFREFGKHNAVVLGVSGNSVKSHGKFATKYKLPFAILADEEKVVLQRYGVWGKKKFMGRQYMGIRRISFLIAPSGKIAKVYDPVRTREHAREVLEDLAVLASK